MVRKIKSSVLVISISIIVSLVWNGGKETAKAVLPNSAVSAFPALPLDCQSNPADTLCLYGYVYYNGTPVNGATVEITSNFGALTLSTAAGTASTSPYFYSTLNTAPLLASPGESISVSATYNGQSSNASYVVTPGSQQVDVIIVLTNDDWWNTSYSYRRPIPISSGGTLGTGTLIKIDGFDFETLVSQGKLRADHNDLRVVRRVSPYNWQEVSRIYFTGQDVEFQLQASINPGTDTSYFVYYGNPGSSTPASFSLPQGYWVDMYHDKWWTDFGGTWSFTIPMNFDNNCDPSTIDHDGHIGSSFDESDKYRGRIYVPYSGTWTFRVYTNDGYRISINGNEIGRFDGYDGSKWYTMNSINLNAGWHRMEFSDMWVNCGSWKIAMEGPSFPNQIVPANYFQMIWDNLVTGINPGAEQTHVVSNPPIVTFNAMVPKDSIAQNQELSLYSSAKDNDEKGESITQYVWRSDVNGVLGTQANLKVAAANLTPGNHMIYVKAKDNEGNWSEEIGRPLVVNTNQTTPTSTPQPAITPSPTPQPTVRGWTFLLYLDGDNELYPTLKRTIETLEAQQANPNVYVVVQFDGDRDGDTWRFWVQPGGNYSIGVNKWFIGEADMGSSQTLSDFILWGREHFPSNYTYVAIADHGRGTTGVAWDETSRRTYISTSGLREALERASLSGQKKIDVLHYDTCLMAMLENAYQIKDFANYLVASENLGWSLFAYDQYQPEDQKLANAIPSAYEFTSLVNSLSSSTTPQQLAANISQLYFNHPRTAGYPRTISAFDLSNADTVRQNLDSLVDALTADLAGNMSLIQNARNAAQKFDSRDYFHITQEDEYVDLYHLADRMNQYSSNPLIQLAAQNLMNAISDQLIIAEYHGSGVYDQSYIDLENAHGVSIYFPARHGGKEYNDYIDHSLFRLTADSKWDNLLVDYFGLSGLPPQEDGEIPLPPMLQPYSYIYLPTLFNVGK